MLIYWGSWSDPIYRNIVFAITGLWILGFIVAMLIGKAWYGQGRFNHGIPWVGHFGFLYLLAVLQFALAYGLAQMWPHWHDRGGVIIVCLMLGAGTGYCLQYFWSWQAGSSDAWSDDGLPNLVGGLHIVLMVLEIGVMWMLLASFIWYQEMPAKLFFGILALLLCHFLIGATHWPLRAWYPSWHPADWTEPLRGIELARMAIATGMLTLIGLVLLSA